MKKIVYSCFICLPLVFACVHQAQAQFILEHQYDSSAFNFQYVKFQFNGEKYVRMSYPSSSYQFSEQQESNYYVGPPEIDIYNLNHSLWKSIPLTFLPFINSNDTLVYYTIMYISDGLFNKDSLVEFLFTTNTSIEAPQGAETVFATYVYNENGTLLFTDSIAGPYYTSVEIPETYAPIVNTSEGTKMILSSGYPNYVVRVYGLAGTLTGVTAAGETQQNAQNTNTGGIKLYPNPARSYTTVQYQLPEGITTAQMVFYDMHSQLVKSFTVDRSFSDLRLSTADLAAGTYYCQLETSSGPLAGKKLVKVN